MSTTTIPSLPILKSSSISASTNTFPNPSAMFRPRTPIPPASYSTTSPTATQATSCSLMPQRAPFACRRRSNPMSTSKPVSASRCLMERTKPGPTCDFDSIMSLTQCSNKPSRLALLTSRPVNSCRPSMTTWWRPCPLSFPAKRIRFTSSGEL